MFEVMDTTLYRLDPKGGQKQVVVPEQLKRLILEENVVGGCRVTFQVTTYSIPELALVVEGYVP